MLSQPRNNFSSNLSRDGVSVIKLFSFLLNALGPSKLECLFLEVFFNIVLPIQLRPGSYSQSLEYWLYSQAGSSIRYNRLDREFNFRGKRSSLLVRNV